MVFYGVSGYTGSLVMEYLKRECLDDVSVCFAGRTLHKVIAMRDKVLAGTRWASCDCVSCDLKEPFEVEALVSSCRVVCNIAGPFMCDLCVLKYRDAFTPSTRLVSISQ